MTDRYHNGVPHIAPSASTLWKPSTCHNFRPEASSLYHDFLALFSSACTYVFCARFLAFVTLPSAFFQALKSSKAPPQSPVKTVLQLQMTSDLLTGFSTPGNQDYGDCPGLQDKKILLFTTAKSTQKPRQLLERNSGVLASGTCSSFPKHYANRYIKT